MKKRMLGLLLALCMVLTLMPVSALADDIDTTEQEAQTPAEEPSVQAQPEGIAAYAAGDHYHCICGKDHRAMGDHAASDIVEYAAWESNNSLPKDGGTYYLTQNVELQNGIYITKETTICLNGHNITTPTGDSCIVVRGTKLILTDCNENPGYISTPSVLDRILVSGLYVMSDYNNKISSGTAELYNISVKNCGEYGIFLSSYDYLNSNSSPNVLRMYNANVTGNKEAGIYGYTSSSCKAQIYIYGGSVSDNGGAGINVSQYDTLTMTGTTVSGNTDQGIVFYKTQNASTIKDCDIYGNEGGGIYLNMDPSSTLTIGGSTKIRDNTRYSNYAGIYLQAGNLVLQGDTEITGNTSGRDINGQGAGVYYNTTDHPTLTIKDNVKITGNKNGKGKESNIAVYGTPSDPMMTIPSDNTFRGSVGFHLESDFPTVDNPVNIVKGDYLSNFTHEGDNTKYLLAYDAASDHVQLQAAPYAEEPTIRSGMAYSGETQTGVFAGAGWTVVSGNTEATDAGDYTVTIKPRDGLTWSDGTEAAKTYNWSIRKADPARRFFTITPPASQTPYDGTVKSVDVALNSPCTGCGDITVEYKYSTTALGSEEAVSAADVKNVGYYSYSIDVAGGKNFNSGKLEGGIFQITKADQSALTITSKNTLPYGQSMTLTAEGGSTHNAIVWQLVDENGNALESSEFASLENGVLTGLKSGTVHIKATMPGDGNNYNDVSATMTITITKGWVTIKADDKTAYIGDTVLPTNGYTVSGLAEGDSLTGDVEYKYYVMEGVDRTEVAPADVDLTKAGEYIIEVSGLNVDTDKYDISFAPGKLSIVSKPSTPSSGSSDSGYKITLPSSVSGGNVKSNVTTAEKGDTVTITVTPATGYVIDKLTVTDKNGNELELTDKGNGRYAFTMPGSKVNVEATFKAEAQQNPEKTGFDDVNDSDWYSEAVDYVAEKGLMSGVGNNLFAPKADTTRGMLMTVLARYAGQDTTGGSVWYEKGMNWAKANGVSDGTNPTAAITREQLVTMLWRYAGEADSTASLDGFNDASTVSNYAVTAMRWAVENGIINGANGSLNPRNNASRAEVAAILMRFCELGK